MVFQNHKTRSLRVRRDVPQASVLGPILFSLFINDLPVFLPSFASFSLCADDLANWSSSVPIAVEIRQAALFRLERWSDHWCLPLNPRKCEASFFSVDPHQAHLQFNLLLLGSRLRFNSTPSFFGVTFDRTLSFSKHVSSLKAKFFLRLKALRCIYASSWCLSKESISVLYEAFLRSFFTDASPGWFLFLSVTNFTKSERNLCLPTSFPISGLARLGVKPRLCRSSWRAFASTHPLMLPSTSSREVLFACSPFRPWNLLSFTVESTLSS